MDPQDSPQDSAQTWEDWDRMDRQEWAQAEWAQAGWAQIPPGNQSQVIHPILPIQYYHLPTQYQQDHTWGQQTSFFDPSASAGHTLDPPLSVPFVYTMEDLDNPPSSKIILEAMRQIWIRRDTDGQGRCEDCNRMGMDNFEWSRLCPTLSRLSHKDLGFMNALPLFVNQLDIYESRNMYVIHK